MREIPGCDHILNLADIQLRPGMIAAIVCNHVEAQGLSKWGGLAETDFSFWSLSTLMDMIKTRKDLLIEKKVVVFATSLNTFEVAEMELHSLGLIASGALVYELREATETTLGFVRVAQFGPF